MRRTLAELTLDLGLLAEAVQRDPPGGVKLLTAPTDPLFAVAYSGRYWQITQAGEPILRSPSLWNYKLMLDRAPTTKSPTFVRLKGPDEQSLFGLARAVSLDAEPGAQPLSIVTAVDYAELTRAKQRFAGDLWIGLSGLAALLLLAASANVIIGLKPLKDIHSRLARVRCGDLRRLEGDFPTEVMPLVNETNALLDAQDTALEAARTRAGDLAHGL